MPRRAKGQPEFPNRVMVEEDLDSEREVMLSGREVGVVGVGRSCKIFGESSFKKMVTSRFYSSMAAKEVLHVPTVFLLLLLPQSHAF
jgi:hypothetical protein